MAELKRRSVAPVIEDVRTDLIERGVSGALQVMTVEKVFWSYICQNLAAAGWVLGALIAGVGLDLPSGMLAIVLGT